MKTPDALITALALSVLATPVAAAEKDNPFRFPLVSYGDYSKPVDAVKAACREGRIKIFLEGLGIPEDCSEEGQARMVAELEKRQVEATCGQLTRDGEILVASFNQDRTKRSYKDQTCEGQTFRGYKDIQGNVRVWYKDNCLNPVIPDAGLPARQKKPFQFLPPPTRNAPAPDARDCPPIIMPSGALRPGIWVGTEGGKPDAGMYFSPPPTNSVGVCE